MSANQRQLEPVLRSEAAAFRYPPAPDLSKHAYAYSSPSNATKRRAAALALVVVIFASLLAVPSVRARLAEFLQIGAVRILRGEPTATPTDPPQSQQDAFAQRPPTATSLPFYVVTSVLELDGETSLQAAREALSFPVPLPTYPPTLGEPHLVFLQDSGVGQFVILVWLDEADRHQAQLVLYVIPEGIQLTKSGPDVVEVAEVNGEFAVLTLGTHLLSVEGFHQPSKLVQGPTLIWVQEGITYRLEADLPAEEMIRIAESLSEGG